MSHVQVDNLTGIESAVQSEGEIVEEQVESKTGKKGPLAKPLEERTDQEILAKLRTELRKIEENRHNWQGLEAGICLGQLVERCRKDADA